MSLQGPFLVVADCPAPDVVEALRAAGGFPIVEANWSEAPAALAAVDPEAVVLAEPRSDSVRVDGLAKALGERESDRERAYMPVLARIRENSTLCMHSALAIAESATAERLVSRLAAALRVRALHGTVLRRTRTLASRGALPPELPESNPLDEAAVLLAGRGRSYPALSLALGERVGVVGSLSVESAARALKVRDIDGVVIGDGFGPRIVEALLTALAEEGRFRDLPVAVLCGHPTAIDRYGRALPNLERINGGAEHLVDRFLPFVRVHAFNERLTRMLASLNAKGMLDPETGLLAHEAFWRDLNRAVEDAEQRGVGLSIARFCLPGGDRRSGLHAARLLCRLMRQIDFACREADNSIFAVFTETDLRAAHVIARRLASVLKNAMIPSDRNSADITAAVTLATLRPTDSVHSLLARVVGGAGAG